MRILLAGFGAAILLVMPLGKLTAVSHHNQEMTELKKRHKEERKTVKQQQKAMKKVMAQHAQSSDSGMRFKHNLKTQRQMVQRSQKDETRRQKKKQKSAKQLHRPT